MLAAMAGVSQVCQLLPSSCANLGRSTQGQGIALEVVCRTLMCVNAMPACKSQHHCQGERVDNHAGSSACTCLQLQLCLVYFQEYTVSLPCHVSE